MGYEISRKEIKKAKKEHQCNACLFLHEHVSECRHDLQMSITEIRAYLEAKKNNFKIKTTSDKTTIKPCDAYQIIRSEKPIILQSKANDKCTTHQKQS